MTLEKFKKRVKKIFVKEGLRLYIDVAHCNLRCAMCPKGSISNLKNEGEGLMELELFKRIIDKFIDENVKIRDLKIGNWGEPLLNPALPEMIKYAKNLRHLFMDREGSFKINTNLTRLENPVELLESGIDHIGVSVSGMTQETYSRNRKGGKVDDVLSNIRKLAEIRDKRGIKGLELQMIFHDFLYNKEEAETARKFCETHNIVFTHNRMYIASVEDNIRFHGDEGEKLAKFYSEYIDLEAEKKCMKTIKNVKKCHLRRRVITINYDGQLYRCAGVFEQKYFMGPFFDHKIMDIPKIRSEICEQCAQTPISFR
jgi:MoaA/NifB/PqqE/SkfB family radical SAM enzyme